VDPLGLALSITSLLVGILSVIIAVVFFVYANQASNEAQRLSVHIDALISEIDKKAMRLVDFAMVSFNRKNVRDDELISDLIAKRDRITENVIERLLPKIEEVPGIKSGLPSERKFLKEELVELTRSTLKESVESELVRSLEAQRDRILEALSEIEQNIRDKHRMPAEDKIQYEELAWKLRQDLDDVKQRIRSISGHT
jgi:hypothetical protein